MHYQEQGEGEYTFVLLHNAGGDLNFFNPQVDVLAQIGRVVLIDLPGHGGSKATESPSVRYFANEVIRLCDDLSLSRVIGIGLNYGANVLCEINVLDPCRLEASVMIDPPMFLTDAVRGLIDNNIAELEHGSPAEHAEELVSQSFIKADAAAKQTAINAFSGIEGAYLANLYRNLLLWDKTSTHKVAALNHDCLVIFTDAALCSTMDIQAANSKIQTAKVVGSMYWATLEVPEQINSMIKRFVALHT